MGRLWQLSLDGVSVHVITYNYLFSVLSGSIQTERFRYSCPKVKFTLDDIECELQSTLLDNYVLLKYSNLEWERLPGEGMAL